MPHTRKYRGLNAAWPFIKAPISQTLPRAGVQYAADNVDHNLRTLDGHNTFHGMGMLAMVTPGTNISQMIPIIDISSPDISGTGYVKVTYCKQDDQALAHIDQSR